MKSPGVKTTRKVSFKTEPNMSANYEPRHVYEDTGGRGTPFTPESPFDVIDDIPFIDEVEMSQPIPDQPAILRQKSKTTAAKPKDKYASDSEVTDPRHRNGPQYLKSRSNNGSSKSHRTLSDRQMRPSSKRKCTEGARHILEILLQQQHLNPSQSPLARHYQGISEMNVIEEEKEKSSENVNVIVETDGGMSPDSQQYSLPPPPPPGDDLENDDGWSSCSPISKTPSIGSQSSSFKHRITRPEPNETLDDMMKKTKKTKKERDRTRSRSSVGSIKSDSSSDSDSEDNFLTRQSWYKWANKKFSIRSKKRGKALNDTPDISPKVKPKKKRSSFSFRKQKDGSSSRSSSDKTGEVIGEYHLHTKGHIHHEINRNSSGNGGIIYNTETREQIMDENFDSRSPSLRRSTILKVKESYPVEEKRKKTKVMDEIKNFFKRGGTKSKSIKKQERSGKSKSADALHMYGVGEFSRLDTGHRTHDPGHATTYEFHEHVADFPSDSIANRTKSADISKSLGAQRHGEPLDDSPFSLGAPRGHMTLKGLRVNKPARTSLVDKDKIDVAYEEDEAGKIVLTEDGTKRAVTHVEHHEYEEDGYDEPDFGDGVATDKPFHEKTEEEKDHLYEKIADQLATIADNYNVGSPMSTKAPSPKDSSSQSELEGATAETPLECKIVNYLKLKADGNSLNNIEVAPIVVKELLKNASYDKFSRVVDTNIGDEPGWQQIAMVFRLTQSAVGLAGYGTALAGQVKELTMKYFEDRFAGWIIGQGGWESAIEDGTDGVTDSELD